MKYDILEMFPAKTKKTGRKLEIKKLKMNIGKS